MKKEFVLGISMLPSAIVMYLVYYGQPLVHTLDTDLRLLVEVQRISRCMLWGSITLLISWGTGLCIVAFATTATESN